SPAASAVPSALDRTRPVAHVRPVTSGSRKELAKLQAGPGGSAGPAEKVPPPAEVTVCSGPTDRLLAEAEDRQGQEAGPAIAIAARPADALPPAGLGPPQDAGLCATAAGSGAAGSGTGRADGGSSGGDAAGGGGQDGGKAGEGAILVPGEFLAGNPPPRYPLIARRKGWEGTVVIDVHVSNTGWVQEARVDKTSGYTVLDDAALGAVRKWRINLHGRSAAASFKFRVPVIFKLTPS
ncbi:MAG TPA: energy transducer TonB, partial [Desulfobacterales bacterium]|nr:energy transducer TonB [Desulfobacterales bacterium]